MREALDKRVSHGLEADFVDADDEVMNQARDELEAYFAAERTEFTVPLLPVGTEFQQRVWAELLNVKYGTTATYQELAKNVSNEKGMRAVANANGANALSIFVPCHRIIGKDGALTGYAGGLEAKGKLLQLEGNLSLF